MLRHVRLRWYWYPDDILASQLSQHFAMSWILNPPNSSLYYLSPPSWCYSLDTMRGKVSLSFLPSLSYLQLLLLCFGAECSKGRNYIGGSSLKSLQSVWGHLNYIISVSTRFSGFARLLNPKPGSAPATHEKLHKVLKNHECLCCL